MSVRKRGVQMKASDSRDFRPAVRHSRQSASSWVSNERSSRRIGAVNRSESRTSININEQHRPVLPRGEQRLAIDKPKSSLIKRFISVIKQNGIAPFSWVARHARRADYRRSVRKNFFPALAGLLLAVAFVPFIALGVQAATAVTLPNQDITTEWSQCNGGTCSSDRYTYINEDVNGSPTTSTHIGTGPTGSSDGTVSVEFGLTNVANVDEATSITVYILAQSATNANGGTLDDIDIDLRIGGSLQGATRVTPSFNSWGVFSATFNGSWSQAQLDDAQVRLTRIVQGGGNPTNQRDDVRVAALSTEVTYTSLVETEQSSYRWFENESQKLAKLDDVDIEPGGGGRQIAFSPEGDYMAIAHEAGCGPFLSIYKFDTTTSSYVKLPDPINAPTGCGAGLSVAFSPNGQYLALGYTSSPRLVTFEIDTETDTFTRTTDPSNPPTSNPYGVAFSADSHYVSAVQQSSLVAVFEADNLLVRVAPGSVDAVEGWANGAAFSPDGKYHAVAHEVSPFVTVQEVDSSEDTFTNLPDPSDLPTGDGRGVAFSPDGNYMSVAHDESPYLTIYSVDSTTDTFTKLPDPSDLPTGDGRGVAFSPDGNYMSVAHDESPYLTIYSVDSTTDTFTKLSDPGDLPGGASSTAFAQDDKQQIGITGYTNPRVSVYQFGAAVNDSLGAQDQPATALTEGTPFRLRATVSADQGDLPAESGNFKLQYAELGPDAVCTADFSGGEEYTDVIDPFDGTSDYVMPADAYSEPVSPSTTTWSSPMNITATSDHASVTLSDSGERSDIFAEDFNFSIPQNAEIEGITVRVNGRAQAIIDFESSETSVNTHTIRLAQDGSPISGSTLKSLELPNSGTPSTATVGGESDMWNTTLDPGDINSETFGVMIRANHTHSSGGDPCVPVCQSSTILDRTWQSIKDFFSPTVYAEDSSSQIHYVEIGITYSISDRLTFYDNSEIPDGSSIVPSSDDPDPGSGNAVMQSYVESNNFTNTNTIPNGDYGIWDFALVDNDAPAEATYCFRIVNADGSELDTYSVIPELRIPPPTFTQSDFRWFDNVEGVDGVDDYVHSNSVVNEDSVGFLNWANPENAIHDDGETADAAAQNGGASQTSVLTNYLMATDFNFNIPDGAEILGIEVEVSRYFNLGSGSGYIDESRAYLVKDEDTIGDNYAGGGGGWSDSPGNAVYGGDDDLWGESWTADDINSSDFGFALSVFLVMDPATTMTASVDHIAMNVYYHDPGGAKNPIAAQNQTATLDEPNQPVSLRMLIDVDDKDATAGDFKLQYAPRLGDVCSIDFSGQNYQDLLVQGGEGGQADTGVASGSVAETDPDGFGTVPWSSISNALTTSPDSAEASLLSTEGTESLIVRDFGFAISNEATIKGIEAHISHTVTNSAVIMPAGHLVRDGTLLSDTAGSRMEGDTLIVGDENDLWGQSWEPADINNAGLGALFTAYSFDDTTISVSHIGIRVYYEFQEGGGNITFYSDSETSNNSPAAPSENDPSNERGTVNQVYVKSNNFQLVNETSRGATAMFNFSMYDNSDLGGNYCFRVVKADGSLLDDYTYVPELGTPPRQQQLMRHGRWFDTAEQNRPFYW